MRYFALLMNKPAFSFGGLVALSLSLRRSTHSESTWVSEPGRGKALLTLECGKFPLVKDTATEPCFLCDKHICF